MKIIILPTMLALFANTAIPASAAPKPSFNYVVSTDRHSRRQKNTANKSHTRNNNFGTRRGWLRNGDFKFSYQLVPPSASTDTRRKAKSK
jgi:hypothetical protein